MTVFKLGVEHPEVVKLQSRLMELGFLRESKPTNYFGSLTDAAVKAYQTKEGLAVDGIVGPITFKRLKESSKEIVDSKALTEEYLEEVADELDVSVALLKAFDKVESAGSGFLPTGEIKVLYERHIFNRELNKAGLTRLADMVRNMYSNLGHTSPGGYVGGIAENKKLVMAKEIHPEIAARSVSYGRYQLMGFRYDWCGFESALEMEEVLNKHEDEHLKALKSFIISQPKLHKAMQDLDFLTMAQIYNGPKQQGYDERLKKAYDKLNT